jgi:hypothetical protein
LKAIQQRHGDVHDDDVDEAARSCRYFISGLRLAHNFNVPFGLHQHSQAFTDDDVVISQENGNFSYHEFELAEDIRSLAFCALDGEGRADRVSPVLHDASPSLDGARSRGKPCHCR